MAWREWEQGDPIAINRIVWGKEERKQIEEVLADDWFGPGRKVKELGKKLAEMTGVEYGLPVNSGSSALTLAVEAMQQLDVWKSGDLILHPALTFPTSCNPLVRAGMIPVFVDVDPLTYNVSTLAVEEAILRYPEIQGAVVPHLLGNAFEVDEVIGLLQHRPLIEDCCDTLGTLYDGQPVGSFGAVSAFSFYGSHHISSFGVGGALLTGSGCVEAIATSMIHWGRAMMNEQDLYEDFIDRYTYTTLGHDMQMTEVQAAFTLAQLDRLDFFNKGRHYQFTTTHEFLAQWGEWLDLPRKHGKADPSWFCFPITISERAPFGREELARALLEANIEIRPMFTGDITRQPAYHGVQYLRGGSLEYAARAGERSLFIPCWGGLTQEQTEIIFNTFERFMEKW